MSTRRCSLCHCVSRFPMMVVLMGSLVSAMAGEEVEARPKLTMLEHPSPQELQQGFEAWAGRHPDRFTFESRGRTPGNRPVLMGRITDYTVPDADKQVAVFTACH